MCRYYGLSERSGRFLSHEIAEEMFSLGQTFLRCHVVLNRLSMARKKRWWVLKPKVHGWHEQLLRVKRFQMNQRYTHNYVDEDAMGWLRRVSAFGSTRAFERNALKRGGYRLRATILRWQKLLKHQRRR